MKFVCDKWIIADTKTLWSLCLYPPGKCQEVKAQIDKQSIGMYHWYCYLRMLNQNPKGRCTSLRLAKATVIRVLNEHGYFQVDERIKKTLVML